MDYNNTILICMSIAIIVLLILITILWREHAKLRKDFNGLEFDMIKDMVATANKTAIMAKATSDKLWMDRNPADQEVSHKPVIEFPTPDEEAFMRDFEKNRL